MRRDDKFRFSLGWSRDTAEKIAVGDLLERLKNRKSDLVIQAVWEYIGNHPEVMAEDAKIVISVHSTPTDEQTFAKIQSMIDASLEKLKTTLKLQLEQGQPEDASGPSEKDLDDMLKNLDIFPPKERDENRVFSKDLMGKRHYYYRFYNENGIELYTLENKRDSWPTIFIPCDGFMVGIDQRSRLAEVLKWLSTLEHGIRAEIERVFNQSMAAPDRWADLGFANLLGRREEAEAHNAPIWAERQQQAKLREAELEAQARQREQELQDRYTSAIREAEQNILAGKEVVNQDINGKSLIMQLFREHGISVPLKTQGWIINTLHSIRYSPQSGQWSYRYHKGSRNSTKLPELLSKLLAAIQSKPPYVGHTVDIPATHATDSSTS